MREGRAEGGREEEEGFKRDEGGVRRVDAADGGGRRVEDGFLGTGTGREGVDDGRGGGGIKDEGVGLGLGSEVVGGS